MVAFKFAPSEPVVGCDHVPAYEKYAPPVHVTVKPMSSPGPNKPETVATRGGAVGFACDHTESVILPRTRPDCSITNRACPPEVPLEFMNEPDQRNAVVDVSCEVAALESVLLALEPILRAAATHPHKTPAHAAICIDNLKMILKFGRMFFTQSW